ncbi:hypothetical protein BJX70DRAFT_402751 [Aspergillus crustosus]
MFGRRIYLQTYTGTGCTGQMRQVALTNSHSCDLETDPEAWGTYRLHIKPPPCQYTEPTNSNKDTIELAMYSDDGCCALEGVTTAGIIDKCHNVPDGQFTAFNSTTDRTSSMMTSRSGLTPRPIARVSPEVTNNLLGEDSMTIQVYNDNRYVMLLQRIIKHTSQETSWSWTSAKNPTGDTWDFRVGGNCGTIEYQSTKQKSKGWISLDQTRQTSTVSCQARTAQARCLEFESSSWEGDACATGTNAPFCDYRTRCDPFYPGDAVLFAGGDLWEMICSRY